MVRMDRFEIEIAMGMIPFHQKGDILKERENTSLLEFLPKHY